MSDYLKDVREIIERFNKITYPDDSNQGLTERLDQEFGEGEGKKIVRYYRSVCMGFEKCSNGKNIHEEFSDDCVSLIPVFYIAGFSVDQVVTKFLVQTVLDKPILYYG